MWTMSNYGYLGPHKFSHFAWFTCAPNKQTHNHPMLYNAFHRMQSPKVPFLWGNLDPHLIHGSLDGLKPISTASRSFHLLLQHLPICPTHTYSQTLIFSNFLYAFKVRREFNLLGTSPVDWAVPEVNIHLHSQTRHTMLLATMSISKAQQFLSLRQYILYILFSVQTNDRWNWL